MKIDIKKIQHIGIPVTNLSNSEAFYKSLGFKNIMNSSFEDGKQTGSVAMLQSGDIVLELYQMPEHKLVEIRNRSNGHIDHIAFDVEDIEYTFELLKSNNFNVLESQPIFLPFWQNGCKYFNITGPDDERLEFNQIL